jgi:hypothetical protein
MGTSGTDGSAEKADEPKPPAVDTASALALLKAQYPDLNFDQDIPESYVFKEGKKKTWETALATLKAKNETILLENEELGEIQTSAKGLSIDEKEKSLYYPENRIKRTL